VNPFAVITPEEMDSGYDSVLGRFGRDGGPLRGELYSEWLIDYPVEDTSKVVWPHLFILSTHRFQLLNTTDVIPDMIGGHSGMLSTLVLHAVRGPELAQGSFEEGDTSLVDIAPTLYEVLGWTAPGNVDGRVLTEILPEP